MQKAAPLIDPGTGMHIFPEQQSPREVKLLSMQGYPPAMQEASLIQNPPYPLGVQTAPSQHAPREL